MSIQYQYQHHHHHRRQLAGMDSLKISETLRVQSNASMKLVKTVAEFSQKVVSIYEQHANSLRTVCDTFRKKTNEVLKDNRDDELPGLVGLWRTILEETDSEAEVNRMLAKSFTDNLVLPLQDYGNQQKQTIKKVIGYQEELEDRLAKHRENLMKCQKEYHESWTKAKSREPSSKSSAMSACYQAHNEYLLQLTAINQFLQKYHQSAVPEVVTDFEESHLHFLKSIAQCLTVTAKAGHDRSKERLKRLESIMDTCAAIENLKDGGRLPAPIRRAMKGQPRDSCNYIIPGHGIPAEFLTEELISNDETSGPLRERHDSLKREARELEVTISYSEKAIETLLDRYETHLENRHYGRANEVKEEILKLKQAKRNAKAQLAICKEQLKLFTQEVLAEGQRDLAAWANREPAATHRASPSEKATGAAEANGGVPSDKTKTPPVSPKHPDAKCNGSVPAAHLFQEHVFKKQTSCENCKGQLIGLTKQCVKCTACKMAAHMKCMELVPPCKRVEGRRKLSRQNSLTALTNFTKKNLLKRQRSLSDIFSRLSTKDENDNTSKDGQSETEAEVDFVYETIKCAKSLSGLAPGEQLRQRERLASCGGYDTDASDVTGRRSSVASTSSVVSSVSLAKTQEARRSIMKGRSISLDHADPKISKKGSVRKRSYAGCETKRSVSLPSDPQKGRIVYQYVDPESAPFQDDLDSSRRYVALYNFEGTKPDDLSLTPGDIVKILDKTSEQWWKGQKLTEVGYFPSFCVEVLQPWERVLRVTRSYTAPEHSDQISLKRNQIVIQISSAENGWARVKTGQREKGRFPYQYLQPVSSRRQDSGST